MGRAGRASHAGTGSLVLYITCDIGPIILLGLQDNWMGVHSSTPDTRQALRIIISVCAQHSDHTVEEYMDTEIGTLLHGYTWIPREGDQVLPFHTDW